jgi:pimeloyl-ACP methyl ester carboxylesterase
VSNDPASEIPTRTGSFRAVVRVGDSVVEYSRSGCGRPVVLLGVPSQSALQIGLSERFKLVVPETAPAGDFMAWLGSFLDGLGLTQVDLVADGFAQPVVEFALQQPERVNRIVLLAARPGEREAADAALATLDGPPAPALCIVRQGSSSDAVVEEVLQFLLEDSPA